MTQQPLWQPDKARIKKSHLHYFIKTVNDRFNTNITNYAELHRWSIDQPTLFWQICAEFCSIKFKNQPNKIIVPGKHMSETKWFDGATFNFAQQLLSRKDNHTAVIATNEKGEEKKISYTALLNNA